MFGRAERPTLKFTRGCNRVAGEEPVEGRRELGFDRESGQPHCARRRKHHDTQKSEDARREASRHRRGAVARRSPGRARHLRLDRCDHCTPPAIAAGAARRIGSTGRRSHRPDGATITAGGARCDRGASNSGGSIRRQQPRLRCHIEQKLSERRRAERRPGDREGGTRCHPPSPRRAAATTASRRRTCCRPAAPCRPYPSRSWCVSCRRGQRQWSARWSACRRAWRRSGLCSCRRA